LHDLPRTRDRAVEGVGVGAIEDEGFGGARIAQRIAAIAAERDVAENAAARATRAEL
jgi:hypothetical protein